jgi:tetratricopeptide (TPR) repeat protein
MRPLVLAALSIAAPAGAAVTVIGGTAARQCYEAADSPLSPTAETLAACDRALGVEPLARRDVIATHVNRGILRVRGGDLAGGLADFDSAVRLDPAVGEAWFNRGAVLLRRNAPAEALASFEEAVARGIDRPALAHLGRAVAHEALGNVRAAYADYRRSSELEPGWERPRAELARFSLRD